MKKTKLIAWILSILTVTTIVIDGIFEQRLPFVVAATTNCPLVDVAGTYTLDLRTETASSWLGKDPEGGCSKTGSVDKDVKIQADGTMIGGGVGWGSGGWHGVFGGRVEPGTEPMKWFGSAGDTEIAGTWRRGQLSGQFVQRFMAGKKEIECRGVVSGFKKGK